MRKFLQKLNIVGCVNVWKEGEALRHCFDNLLRWCDYIVIMMDHPSKETEDIVNTYKKKYPDIFRVGYANSPKLKNPKNVRRREKVYRSDLVEQKLALVKKIHEEEKPIDILLTPDSDEIYVDILPSLLEEFMKSNHTSICMKSFDVYDTPYILHTKGMMSHWRIYKYRDDISFTPRRQQSFYYPYKATDTWKIIGGFVHLSQLKEFRKIRDLIGDTPMVNIHPNTKLYRLDRPVWSLTKYEYNKIIEGRHVCLLKDYEKLFKRS